MAILSGDIKLVASQVMDDVTEGGGAPTATLIVDGASNAVFPDISEMDRAGGRVNLRKLHVTVQTPDTDTYLGSNVIVAQPPEDPNVSITLFSTRSTFDRRDAAQSRVESYLNRGPMWPGILLNNHITGQRSVQLLQRKDSELPSIGQTIVLVQNEGLESEKAQYLRTTEVVYEMRIYYNDTTPVEMWVVTCTTSDALRYDFTGSEGDYKMTVATGAARVRDTVVADAGTYVGVVPLTVSAAIGDFMVTAESVYTNLVPSAQTETAISDVRTNGLSTALVATGNTVTRTVTSVFDVAQNLYVGGPIYPGSLSLVRSSVTLTDVGGVLKNGGVSVGEVDYDNGILSLSSNIFGTGGGAHAITFKPATTPDLISDQRAIKITPESRSMTYALTLLDPPEPRSLAISYLAQGRWYTLRDNGGGVLAGSSSAYGAGTLSYSTGSLSVTLGALPDVGSSLIFQSYSKATTVQSSNTVLTNSGKLFFPINSDGVVSEEKGTKVFARSTLGVTWDDNGVGKVASESGSGILSGDATGTIDYANGVMWVSPNTLPPPGTVFTVGHASANATTSIGVTLAGGSVGATDLTPFSVSFTMMVSLAFSGTVGVSTYNYTIPNPVRQVQVQVRDDGAGNLVCNLGASESVACGSIDYITGIVSFVAPTIVPNSVDGPTVSVGVFVSPWTYSYQIGWKEYATNPGNAASVVMTPPSSANVTYSASSSSVGAITATINQYMARVVVVPNYTLKGVGFTLGGAVYQELTDGTLVKDPSPLTGVGTPAGSVSGALGAAAVSVWDVGATSTIGDWRGLLSPPTVGVAAPFTAFSTMFRTASCPLRTSSLSVLGTMQDGTTFNVTADGSGKINGTRVKGQVDVQYGIVELYFVNPAGSSDYNIDLSHLGIPGLATIPADLVMLNSIRYNAVSYSYLPLDASILGIDPVRLPSDGRVPIFRSGGFAVVGNTASVTATVSNAQVIDCARVRLSRVRVIGHDGVVINTGYTADLEAGTVTFTDVAGYSQPVTVENRIEDMAIVSDVQISGELTFTRPITHDYPAGSYVSSALVAGDLKSRVSVLFDQATWSSTWLDAVSGSSATGTFNDVSYPLTVTNAGTVSERWALQFTNSTTFNIIGEHVGVIGTGSVNGGTTYLGIDVACAPINPATGVAYFVVPKLGFGSGWSVGNVLRFNTVGAMFPVWVVRTIQQGPNTGTSHSFTLLSRGDVDRP